MRSRAGISSQSNAETIMKWFSRASAILSILVGLLVLAAWKLAIVMVITAGSDRKGMARSTALLLILCGTSLLALQDSASNRRIRRLGTGGAVLAIIIGAATLLRLVGVLTPYLDENLLFGPLPMGGTFLSVQMAPNTAVCLILVGLSLVFMDVPLRDDTGKIVKWFGTCTEIDDLKRTEESLRGLVLLDDLTGLHNRRGFWVLAEQQMKVSRRTCSPFLLIFLDVDGLKNINDTLGHAAGSRAIIETADILRSCFRKSDILARFGGDEFVVLAVETPAPAEAALLAHIKERLAAANSEPHRMYRLSLSIGVLPCDATTQSSLDELLTKVDSLMYEDKRSKAVAGL